jgi:16S rRNA (uracil1498-N3)-methyltransferase
MARFFLPKQKIHGRKGLVEGQELEHMRRVLRLTPGDRVTVFDSEGTEHEAVLRSYTPDTGEVEILRSYEPDRESSLEITLAQALGKGDKMDWIVEKSTELGVKLIVPFLSSYTVPRPGAEGIERRRQRWKRIALSAAKQSGRSKIPEIGEFMDFHGLIATPWPCDLKLLFWEGEKVQGLAELREERADLGSLLLVVGPEGGFTVGEVEEAWRRGFRSTRIGKRILRAETAALASISVVQFLWGDMA